MKASFESQVNSFHQEVDKFAARWNQLKPKVIINTLCNYPNTCITGKLNNHYLEVWSEHMVGLLINFNVRMKVK